MARNRGKKSLYEVIGKNHLKSCYDKTLEQPHPEKLDRDQPAIAKPAGAIPKRAVIWPRKPKIVQFNAGRVEFSIPYPLAIALLMGLVLIVLLAVRLGQIGYSQKTANPGRETPANAQTMAEIITNSTRYIPDTTAKIPVNAGRTTLTESKGDNRIVIQTYRLRAHLEPAKQYFAQFGIETEIRKIGNWYYLVTKNKYENPKRPGTDGYLAIQKIIELGAKYKAPQGYETFGPKPFHDAYGMKSDD